MMAWDDEPDMNLTDDYVPEQHGGRLSAVNARVKGFGAAMENCMNI